MLPFDHMSGQTCLTEVAAAADVGFGYLSEGATAGACRIAAVENASAVVIT